MITGSISGAGVAAAGLFQILIPSPKERDAELGSLYSDKAGRVVMEYDLGRTTDDQVYFTDGHPLYDINKAQAQALADTPFLLGKFASAHGLDLIRPDYMGSQIGSTSLRSYSIDAPKCQWPYNPVLEITRGGKSSTKIMFLRRREYPVTKTYEFWCERGPGKIELTTTFEALSPLLYTDKNGGVLLAFPKPASVFRYDETGTLSGPQLTSDILMVPAGISEDMLSLAAEARMTPQGAVNHFEQMLQAMNGSVHGKE